MSSFPYLFFRRDPVKNCPYRKCCLVAIPVNRHESVVEFRECKKCLYDKKLFGPDRSLVSPQDHKECVEWKKQLGFHKNSELGSGIKRTKYR